MWVIEIIGSIALQEIGYRKYGPYYPQPICKTTVQFEVCGVRDRRNDWIFPASETGLDALNSV